MPDVIDWEDVINQLIKANNLYTSTATVKLLISKNSQDREVDNNIFCVIFARQYIHRLETLYKIGLNLTTYPHPRQLSLAVL